MTEDKTKGRSVGGQRAEGEVDEAEETLRQRVEDAIERFVPEVLKRTLDAGLGTLSRTDKGRLRGLVNDLKLPREVARYVLAQVDETKNALLRVVAREVREFLEHTDLADAMIKALTSLTLSLDISTRVRFLPNEAGTGVKPDIVITKVGSKVPPPAEPSDAEAQDEEQTRD